MKQFLISLLLVLMVGCSSAPKIVDDGIAPDTRQRVTQWKQLIDSGSRWSDRQKLTKVNDFVNQLIFVDDVIHWQKEDYWATPLQTLVTKGGGL